MAQGPPDSLYLLLMILILQIINLYVINVLLITLDLAICLLVFHVLKDLFLIVVLQNVLNVEKILIKNVLRILIHFALLIILLANSDGVSEYF